MVLHSCCGCGAHQHDRATPRPTLPMQATFLEGSGTLSLPYASSRVYRRNYQIISERIFIVFSAAAIYRSQDRATRSGHFPSHPDEPTGSLPPCGWPTGETCRSNTRISSNNSLIDISDKTGTNTCSAAFPALPDQLPQLFVDEKLSIFLPH